MTFQDIPITQVDQNERPVGNFKSFRFKGERTVFVRTDGNSAQALQLDPHQRYYLGVAGRTNICPDEEVES